MHEEKFNYISISRFISLILLLTSVSLNILSLYQLFHDFEYFMSLFALLTRTFGRMMFLRHLGKSVKLKAYPRTVRCVKCNWWSGGFLFTVFCLEKISMNAIFRTFPHAKTTYNLLWNSKNVTNITKALEVRENIK